MFSHFITALAVIFWLAGLMLPFDDVPQGLWAYLFVAVACGLAAATGQLVQRIFTSEN